MISRKWNKELFSGFQETKKGEAVRLLPLSVIDCVFLLYNQFLCAYCISADDSDVVNAACVVACVEFVCAFAHIVAQNYASLHVAYNNLSCIHQTVYADSSFVFCRVRINVRNDAYSCRIA